MGRRKNEMLRRIGDKDLRELARSVSVESVGDNASRSDLVKIIRNSASIEEIERKMSQISDETKHMKSENTKQTGVIRSIYSLRLLKTSIPLVFAGLVLSRITEWYADWVYVYSFQVYVTLGLIASIIRIIGLAILTYWLFSSALRANTTNQTTAAILVIGGSILMAGILISYLPVTHPYF